MLKLLRQAFVLFLFLSLLTGILYPLALTGIAQAAFHERANGSIILQDGVPAGSALIGQAFTDRRYFWGRPSATAGSPYNAYDGQALTGSSGSNLGPLSKALVERVQARVYELHSADPGNRLPVPLDLVTTSASGLDPHISPEAAYYQVQRIASLRGLDAAVVKALVDEYIEYPLPYFLGSPHVNVLVLNLALDEIQ